MIGRGEILEKVLKGEEFSSWGEGGWTGRRGYKGRGGRRAGAPWISEGGARGGVHYLAK